jgi:hypothetical protein
MKDVTHILTAIEKGDAKAGTAVVAERPARA